MQVLTIEQSFQVMWSLVEQNLGTGAFKRLADLDCVRGALSNIETHVSDLENKLKNASKTATPGSYRPGNPE